MTSPDHLHRVVVRVPPEHADQFAVALEPLCDSVAWTAREGQPKAQITGFAEGPPDEGLVAKAVASVAAETGALQPEVEFSRIPVQNWVVENIKQFPPITVGRYFIHGSGFEEPLPYSKLSLCVPAGAAFGTGDHGSTKGCLMALDQMEGRPVQAALDMGCGSGVLALAVAKRWKCRVGASDIDEAAGRTTRANVFENGLRRYVDTYVGPGYRNRPFKNRQYDLVVSNILARPLMLLSRDLSRHVAPGGTVILAGLLFTQEAQVISAHRRHGLHLEKRIRIDDWSTLVFRRRA